jgi:predicted MFS family arabinose efflux permease
MFTRMSLDDAHSLPRWRRPEALLYVMAAAMPLAFATWSALLNNFVIEMAGFTGVEIGWLHTVREIPGLLAVLVIALLLVMREQVLALTSLLLLGLATVVTAWFPSFGGLLIVTLLSSIGFHYFETVNQSLQLQWVEKSRAPQVLGRIVAVGSGASLLAYGLLVLLWDRLNLSYDTVYMAAGGATIALTLFAALAYPQFVNPITQRNSIVLRRRYWLYYALQFMSGSRRQIFVVFAGFMMVERFGMNVSEMTGLLLVNYVLQMVAAPAMGRALGHYGERSVMAFEYIGLTVVFLAYGGLYWFGWGIVIAGALYIADQMFFALSFALRTYFQKIADPADIAPSAAVAFTINHIAAVFLPAGMGYLWAASPDYVFLVGAGMALIALGLVLLIPRHPQPGHETILSRGLPLPAA